MHARLKSDYLAEMAPDESARLAALEAATEALMQAAEGYDAHHNALLDWGEVGLLERGAKEPEAA